MRTEASHSLSTLKAPRIGGGPYSAGSEKVETKSADPLRFLSARFLRADLTHITRGKREGRIVHCNPCSTFLSDAERNNHQY